MSGAKHCVRNKAKRDDDDDDDEMMTGRMKPRPSSMLPNDSN